MRLLKTHSNRYCTECGKRKIPLPTGKYNEDTGEAIIENTCVNNNCTIGSTKHIFKGIYKDEKGFHVVF